MDIHKVEPDAELAARAEVERPEYPSAEVRPFVVELANRGRVRAEEWAIAMNSYERELLTPHLETAVFLQMVEYCLANCGRKDGPTYDAALQYRYMPDALRRMREMCAAIALQERRWQEVTDRAEELTRKQDSIRKEARRLTGLLTFVINWCKEKPEDDKPGPFCKDTYKDGLRYAKRIILRGVLGRIEPGGSEQSSEVDA